MSVNEFKEMVLKELNRELGPRYPVVYQISGMCPELTESCILLDYLTCHRDLNVAYWLFKIGYRYDMLSSSGLNVYEILDRLYVYYRAGTEDDTEIDDLALLYRIVSFISYVGVSSLDVLLDSHYSDFLCFSLLEESMGLSLSNLDKYIPYDEYFVKFPRVISEEEVLVEFSECHDNSLLFGYSNMILKLQLLDNLTVQFSVDDKHNVIKKVRLFSMPGRSKNICLCHYSLDVYGCWIIYELMNIDIWTHTFESIPQNNVNYKVVYRVLHKIMMNTVEAEELIPVSDSQLWWLIPLLIHCLNKDIVSEDIKHYLYERSSDTPYMRNKLLSSIDSELFSRDIIDFFDLFTGSIDQNILHIPREFSDPLFGERVNNCRILSHDTDTYRIEFNYESCNSTTADILYSENLVPLKIQSLYHIMNIIWQNSNLAIKPFIYERAGIEINHDVVLLEDLDDIIPVLDYDWDEISTNKSGSRFSLFASFAGNAISNFIFSFGDMIIQKTWIKNKSIIVVDALDIFHPEYYLYEGSFPNLLFNFSTDDIQFMLGLLKKGFIVARRNATLIEYFSLLIFEDLISPSLVKQILNRAFDKGNTEEDAVHNFLTMVKSTLIVSKINNTSLF